MKKFIGYIFGIIYSLQNVVVDSFVNVMNFFFRSIKASMQF